MSRRERTRWLSAALLVLAAASPWAISGCGVEEAEALQSAEPRALMVTPQFRVVGLEGAAEDVFLQDLYLGIGEVRLEPLGDAGEVVYVTRTPMHLHFDLAAGAWLLEGAPLTLPHGGEYLISVTLEPMGDSPSTDHSVRIDGLFARKSTPGVSLRVPSTDEPMPVPWRDPAEQGEDGCLEPSSRRAEWVPWTYTTQRPLNILLNDVQFSDEESEQSLVITFDLQDWLVEAFRPLRVAVESSEVEELPSHGEGSAGRVEPLDVTSALDRLGAGMETLDGFSEARVTRR